MKAVAVRHELNQNPVKKGTKVSEPAKSCRIQKLRGFYLGPNLISDSIKVLSAW
jgi:hypothetical protein